MNWSGYRIFGVKVAGNGGGSNSPSQDYTYPDDRTLLNYELNTTLLIESSFSLESKSTKGGPYPLACLDQGVQTAVPPALVLDASFCCLKISALEPSFVYIRLSTCSRIRT